MPYTSPDLQDSPSTATPLSSANIEAWLLGAGGYADLKAPISVKEQPYSAVGNGSTNDRAAIHSARDAAGTYGALFFPAGTYIADDLQPLDGQTWFGPGVIQRPAGGTAANAIIVTTGKTRVTIDLTIDGGLGITFSGNSDNDTFTATGPCINFAGASSHCTARGRIRNNGGTAVRIYDSSYCRATQLDVYNCDYGVLVGSGGTAADPSGVCSYNQVTSCVFRIIGKNGVFTTGRTDSGTSPNDIEGINISGIVVFQAGDTGIELGHGTRRSSVNGFVIDGNNPTTNGTATPALKSYNGILVREVDTCSISNGTIRNFATYGTGSYIFRTLGNGIYFWPQHVRGSTNCTVSNVTIENCSRGIYVQGNNTSLLNAASTDGGGAGTGGQTFDGGSITNCTVKGGQIGSGTGAQDLANLSLHGIFLESVTGWTVTNCTVQGVQNDGFRIGDSANSSAWCSDVDLIGCRAFNNGQQQYAANLYYGFYLAGSASQTRINLMACRGNDYQGTKTQDYAYVWNSLGAGGMVLAANLTKCTGQGNAVGVYNGTGSDVFGAIGGGNVASTGNITANAQDSILVYSGTGGHTVTIGSATFNGDGRLFLVRNTGTSSVRVDRNSSVKLVDIPAGGETLFRSDGTSWIFTNDSGAATVASATTLGIPPAEYVNITGNTNITGGILAGRPGQRVTLMFASTPTVSNTANTLLAGGASFVASANDTLSLICDGTNWYETARSLN